jgi:hypothetical protein
MKEICGICGTHGETGKAYDILDESLRRYGDPDEFGGYYYLFMCGVFNSAASISLETMWGKVVG